MDKCARCGKELSWRERQFYWQSQLRHGYIVFPFSFFGSSKNKKEFPEYKGKKLCQSCVLTLFNAGYTCKYCGKRYVGFHHCKERDQYLKHLKEERKQYFKKLYADLNNPDVKTCNKCAYFEEVIHERGGVDDLGVYIDESYSTFKCKKFDFDLDETKYYYAQRCSSYITKKEYEEKCLSGEIEKENAKIILDFSSLKEVLIKGGIVMSAYNCPKCNATLDIPDEGKIIFCKYCGTPIKPVDIFERVKSLIH